MATESPYGSWKSPLSSKLASDSSISIRSICVDAKTPDMVYWAELHPAEAGHTIVFSCDVTQPTITPLRLTPENGFNVADKVHEYGGGAFIVHDAAVYFSNFDDGKIYKQKGNQAPSAVTKSENFRYADADFYEPGQHLFCVREDDTNLANHPEPVNTTVAINVDTGDENVMVSGYDFYSNPRVPHDG